VFFEVEAHLEALTISLDDMDDLEKAGPQNIVVQKCTDLRCRDLLYCRAFQSSVKYAIPT